MVLIVTNKKLFSSAPPGLTVLYLVCVCVHVWGWGIFSWESIRTKDNKVQMGLALGKAL